MREKASGFLHVKFLLARRRELRCRMEGFIANKRGVVAITFAVTGLFMVAMVGGAYDYSSYTNYRSKLQAITDSAALLAVGQGLVDTDPVAAKRHSEQYLTTQLEQIKYVYDVAPRVEVTDDGQGTRSSTVTITGKVNTGFMGIVGVNALPVSVTGTAGSSFLQYVDFYLLLDNTPSMGLGATTADIQRLKSLTVDPKIADRVNGCGFACHEISSRGKDTYTIAKENGIVTRIDVVRQSVQALTDTARKIQGTMNYYKMAVYSFGEKAESPGLARVAPLESNLMNVKSNASALNLMTIPYQGYNNDQLTDLNSAVSSISAEIGTAGRGGRADDARKVLFFVTDGVADYANRRCSNRSTPSNSRCQEPIRPEYCTTLKDRGVKVAILYTTYIELPDNDWYNFTIRPWAADIAPKLKACASPDLFFEVNPTQGIQLAMDTLFKRTLQKVRLSH